MPAAPPGPRRPARRPAGRPRPSYARRRAVVAAVLAGVVLAAVVLAAGLGRSDGPRGAGATRAVPVGSSAPVAPAAVATRARLAGFRLPVPLSRLVVLPGSGRLLLLGGLDAADTSVATVATLDPVTGGYRVAGRLEAPVHDAAGVVVGHRALLFGGGTAASVATVESVPLDGGVGAVLGQLPQPRSDLAAVSWRGVAYVLGGYTGLRELPEVLATTDGVRFRTVARLPVGVRYAAVAVLDGVVWVLGGEHDGALVDLVQRVDLATGSASVAGHLPAPLDGASAFVLGGSLFLAGGHSAAGTQAGVWRLVASAHGAQVVPAGRLAAPVAFAGSAVLDGVGYLVGGEAPATVAQVQTLRALG